jgi:hypothetical protein
LGGYDINKHSERRFVVAFPNLSEIVTTTLRNRTGELADNMSRNNAALLRLTRRGNLKTFSGGRTIVQELNYADNQTFCKRDVIKLSLIDSNILMRTTRRKAVCHRDRLSERGRKACNSQTSSNNEMKLERMTRSGHPHDRITALIV